MKRFVRWLFGILITLGVVFAGGAYVLPGEAVVQRQTVIDAPPEKVWALVGSLKRAGEWSPWAELDPKMKLTFEGPDTGVGQKMSWVSDHPDVGTGSQTVIEWVENQRAVSALDFGGMGQATASVEISPVNGGTGVTWGFKAKLNNPIERWFGLMFDRWIGADFERGLTRLKTVAEKP